MDDEYIINDCRNKRPLKKLFRTSKKLEKEKRAKKSPMWFNDRNDYIYEHNSKSDQDDYVSGVQEQCDCYYDYYYYVPEVIYSPREECANLYCRLKYKQNQKQRLEVNLKKCDFVANRLIDESLFGFHHPYGRYTSTLDYDAVDRESILNFYKQYYQAGNCKIFIAGKLPDDYQTILNKAFGTLPFNNTDLFQKEFQAAPSAEKKINIINDANGVQAAVRIARNFPNKHHPDFQKCLVLNNVFGGFFGSRLMSNIREDKGYTYGIHSYLQNHVHESAWMISTECGRDVSAATVSEVYKEMLRLQDELIDAAELELVRNYMIGTLLGDLDGPFQILSRWKSYLLNNLTVDYFNSAIKTIKTVSAEELQTLAKKYLNPDEFFELVVV